MELRIRGERVVLAGSGSAGAREIDPRGLAIDVELADALHEWARVAVAVRRAGRGAAADAVGSRAEAASVVSQRGRQLAARVAAVMGTSVHYLDPITEVEVLVEPPRRTVAAGREASVAKRFFGVPEPGDEPTPWLTGLAVAAFVAVVIAVAMLALTGTLARETGGWLAIAVAAVVTGGLAPSLWVARKLPILRWVALGVAVGVLVAWVGVLGQAL